MKIKRIIHNPELTGPPSLPTQVKNFSKALAEWTAEGAPITPDDWLEVRKAICLQCKDWDPEAFAGTGRCLKCGCSAIKLSLATQACPVGKWKALPKNNNGPGTSDQITKD